MKQILQIIFEFKSSKATGIQRLTIFIAIYVKKLRYHY